jgi:hypothetical protein
MGVEPAALSPLPPVVVVADASLGFRFPLRLPAEAARSAATPPFSILTHALSRGREGACGRVFARERKEVSSIFFFRERERRGRRRGRKREAILFPLLETGLVPGLAFAMAFLGRVECALVLNEIREARAATGRGAARSSFQDEVERGAFNGDRGVCPLFSFQTYRACLFNSVSLSLSLSLPEHGALLLQSQRASLALEEKREEESSESFSFFSFLFFFAT